MMKFTFGRSRVGRNWWKYWRPKRLTLKDSPAIYRWLFWAFSFNPAVDWTPAGPTKELEMGNWKDEGEISTLKLPDGILVPLASRFSDPDLLCLRVSKDPSNGWWCWNLGCFVETKEQAQKLVEGAARVQIQRIANILGGEVKWEVP
jgi:hypothetical protein